MIESNKNLEFETKQAQIEQLQSELELANRHLLEYEHERGVAELSAGVLHNIGNTLTPSKIAVSMLLQRLQQSPLLKHIGGILKPLEDVIPTCDLPEDEKKKLQKIIQLLPGSLEEEYQKNIEDVINIRNKQEHIASIITLHMRYSHLKADYCDVNMQRIIDDAVSMQSESISKRGIKVKKEIEPARHVKVQESKLLQILNNLLKNAYESIDMNPGSDKMILIRCLEQNSTVAIKIKDTGIGFETGEEQQFFEFGFTSKIQGSGLGLHFCAHFLHSIGGDIMATSEGKGKGAEFIITLPA